MTYQNFLSDTIAALAPRLSSEADIRAEVVKKNNGYCPTALIISEPGTNMFPTIYMDEYYERAKNGDGIDCLSDEIYHRYQKYKINCKLDTSIFSDFEKIKDLVIYRLVNKEKNTELLNEIPFLEFLDLAIIFCISLRSDEDISASTIIHNSHLKSWNVSADALYELACNNTRRILEPDVCSLPDFLNNIAGKIIMETPEPDKLMYVLTNERRTHGAACLLYDDVIKDFSDRFKRDVFILPSSIHEVMLLCDDGTTSMEDLDELVRDVNDSQLTIEEVLSDHAYKYVRDENRIIF